MYQHFNNNNLLAAQQYGFRKLHSTEYAAVKLIDHVSKQMESGNIPCTLYIDLSKAFDTLSFDILIHKLKYFFFVWDIIKKYIDKLLDEQNTIC